MKSLQKQVLNSLDRKKAEYMNKRGVLGLDTAGAVFKFVLILAVLAKDVSEIKFLKSFAAVFVRGTLLTLISFGLLWPFLLLSGLAKTL